MDRMIPPEPLREPQLHPPRTAPRSASGIARFLRWLAWVAVALTGGGTLLTALAGRHWVADLFSHFPVHYLGGATLAALVFIATAGRRLPLFIAVAVVAVNLVIVWPYLAGSLRALPAQPEGAGISMVAWNLNYRNVDFESARAYLGARDHDVLLLTEFTPRWREALAALEEEYTYVALHPRFDAWGIGLYSRYPIEVEALDLVEKASTTLRVLVDLPGGPLRLYGVHLFSPTSGKASELRNAQLDLLAGMVSAEDRVPVMVAGDFNVTPFSPWFRKFTRATGLGDARRPFGLHFTWPVARIPIWVAIDHCLVNDAVDVGRVVAGRAAGSDHLPLEISFSLR